MNWFVPRENRFLSREKNWRKNCNRLAGRLTPFCFSDFSVFSRPRRLRRRERVAREAKEEEEEEEGVEGGKNGGREPRTATAPAPFDQQRAQIVR